ncbi:MAG: minor capsid protein [Oscillospiraceae bacterium]|jgi:SPP1 gp7 family putative phage head morphogenesis protein|nr:minor capsid protein [Oscillospiraceae bacterium]
MAEAAKNATGASARYWERRASERMDDYHAAGDKVIYTISQAHGHSLEAITRDIYKVRRAYAERFGLDEADAAKYLADPVGYDEYQRLKRQISFMPDGDAKNALQARASSGAYAFRISRLDALGMSVEAQTAILSGRAEKALGSHLERVAEDAYNDAGYGVALQSGILTSFARAGGDLLREILRQPWSGGNYSKNIWGSGEALARQLNEVINKGMLNGWGHKRMAGELARRMGVSISNASRIVRTETTYVANQATIAGFRASGVEWYEFLATLDSRTSAVCQDNDGEKFLVADAQPGVNLPPLHPNCRSTIVAAIDAQDKARLERTAMNENGRFYRVPASMTYKEWAEKAMGGRVRSPDPGGSSDTDAPTKAAAAGAARGEAASSALDELLRQTATPDYTVPDRQAMPQTVYVQPFGGDMPDDAYQRLMREKASAHRSDAAYETQGFPPEDVQEFPPEGVQEFPPDGVQEFPLDEAQEFPALQTRREFGKYGTLVVNSGITPVFSDRGHGYERMRERGLTENSVRDIIRQGAVLKQAGGKTLYVSRGGAVVLTGDGRIVTAWGENQFTDDFKRDVLRRLFGGS